MMKSPLSYRLAPVLIGASLLGLSACGQKNDAGTANTTTNQFEMPNSAGTGDETTLQNGADANAMLAGENASGSNMASHEGREHEAKEEAREHGARTEEGVTAGAGATAPAAAPTTISYACSGNVTISAAFAPNGGESVTVTLTDGSQVVLPREVTASGARYAKSGYELWQKGDGATWNDGKHPTMKCKPQ